MLLSFRPFAPILALILSSPFHALQAEEELPGVGSEILQSVSVSASRHRRGESLISELVVPDSTATAIGSIAEMLALDPAISLNGQPGLFQTLNIRGLARQRLQSFLNGMRLTSERRAGVSSSFIDPLLLSGVEVIQGPASTYYGSGALAGAIQMLTREDASPWLSTGLGTDGNERSLAAGTGSMDYSTGFAFRQRDEGESIRGQKKHDSFSQLSAYFQKQFQLGDYDLDWQLVGSHGRDIGKDNSQFPSERVVEYPEENHLLSQFKISGQGDWEARAFVHYQDLLTQETLPRVRQSDIQNRSLDFGLAFEDQWNLGELVGQLGVDYFGRRRVQATQRESDLNAPPIVFSEPIADGEENETALFATANRDFNFLSLHAGIRLTHFNQSVRDAVQLSDAFTSYFFTLRKPVGALNIALSYGTSSRFASLTERFFSGATGRGQVVGNPALRPEESSELDLALEYQGEAIAFELHGFITDVDDFIERTVLDENRLGFSNLVNGEIEGWQYRLNWFPDSTWQLQFSGQGVTGVSEEGVTLIDIPAKRHQIDVSYTAASWSARLSYRRRLDKRTFGATESILQAANIGAFKLNYDLNERWQLQAGIENLFDDSYFSSADVLSTLAIGREFTLGFNYR